MSTNQIVKITFDFDLGNVPASAKRMKDALAGTITDTKQLDIATKQLATSLGQLSTAQTKVAATTATVGNSVKKSNMQWTNFALVIQDLPYGFRGIQNNLPALIGGIAGVAGPLYLVGSAVIAFFTAWDNGFFKTKKSTEELTGSLKNYNIELSKAIVSASSETTQINGLVEAAKNHNLTMDLRLQAVDKLQKQYPAYFGNLTQEEILNGKVKKAVDDVKVALINRSIATAASSEIDKIASQKLLNNEQLYQLALLKTAKIKEINAFYDKVEAQGIATTGAKQKLLQAQVAPFREQENRIKADNLRLDAKALWYQNEYNNALTNSLELELKVEKLNNVNKKEKIKAAKEAASLAAYAAKRMAMAGGDVSFVGEPKIDPNAQAKAFADKMAFDKRMSKERVDFIKSQYELEVSEAQGSFDKIKIAEENMRNSLNQGFMDGTIKLDEYITAIQELRKKSNKTILDETDAQLQQTLKLGIGIMSALGPSLDMLLQKGASVGEVLSQAFQDVFKKLLKVIIAATIAVALMAAFGVIPKDAAGKLLTGKVFGGLIGQGMGLGANLFGEYASGGIVSGPTMGLMGEYPGAAHNPEVVAPLDKLKDLIGDSGGSGGSFVLRGQDLVLAMNRSESSLKLRRG